MTDNRATSATLDSKADDALRGELFHAIHAASEHTAELGMAKLRLSGNVTNRVVDAVLQVLASRRTPTLRAPEVTGEDVRQLCDALHEAISVVRSGQRAYIGDHEIITAQINSATPARWSDLLHQVNSRRQATGQRRSDGGDDAR